MTTLCLEIPTEVQAALRLPPDEVEREMRRELALALYARRVLSLGKARSLAQATRWEFEELLGERRLPRHYEGDDLVDDIAYANRD